MRPNLNVELYKVSLLAPLTPIIMHAAGFRIMVLHSTMKQYALTVQLEYFDHKVGLTQITQWVIQVSDVDPVATLAVVASKIH